MDKTRKISTKTHTYLNIYNRSSIEKVLIYTQNDYRFALACTFSDSFQYLIMYKEGCPYVLFTPWHCSKVPVLTADDDSIALFCYIYSLQHVKCSVKLQFMISNGI